VNSAVRVRLRACLRASHEYHEYGCLKVDLDGTDGSYSPTTVATIAGVGLMLLLKPGF
jgi:hypothetical protein